MKALTDRSKIPRASFVFIDSNIFTYFLLRDADFFEKCSRFLKNIESGYFIGFINNIVISETLFNFVKAEVCKNHGLKPNEFIRYVKENPESIGDVDISDVIDVFTMVNLNLVDVPPKLIPILKDVHRKSLLSNDAFHLLTMEYLNIKDIVTNDGDFERIAGIKVWKPETL
ncbi:MAG: PIN domain-containing protein [Candidatus Methanoperedens sp.]|nr:PIN domain-containing protein [Candidatus Methanoperedens sp.]